MGNKTVFILTLAILVLIQNTKAQNTFPSSGSAGIGTTSPGTTSLKIQLSNADGGATNAPRISVINTSTFNPAGSGANYAWMDLMSGNLAVQGQFVCSYGNPGYAPFNSGSGLYIATRTDHPLIFVTGATSTEKMRITPSGSVGIGTINVNDPNYKLFVETGIRTRMIKVDQAAWPDYVFAPSYYLLPLKELQTYLKINRHLPGIASAEEVEKNGVDLGANKAAILKQIEELTLYIIDQDHEIKILQKEIAQLKTRNKVKKNGNSGFRKIK